ncbi:MAG: penicillin-binding protein 2 [Gammaproteobacteria bacterium]|nr:penicillin-binding protein 2 [Gammaproteobacteria bacterium]
MSFGRRLREPSREAQLFARRIVIAALGMVVLIALLLSRLVYLQLVHHDHFTTLAQENRLKVLPIAPTRGLIYSSDGVLLADNRASFSLEVVPEKAGDLSAALAQLQAYVSVGPELLARLKSELRQRRRFDSIAVKDNLTAQEVAVFSANRHSFPGFGIAGRLARYYPLGAQTVSAVGYVGRISEEELKRIDISNYSGTMHIGKEGVERFYEAQLHGEVGYQQVEVNAQGRILRVVESQAPVPGRNLYLSIDTRLQDAALKTLNGLTGAIVAIEPATGSVLAFVSNPAFDPNDFVNGISAALYKTLRDAPERPMFNRALLGLYPPGSTIKPVMAAGALEYGLRERGTPTWCPGWLQLPGVTHKYRCWQKSGHGTVDLLRSIAESCDVYYYSLARDMGIDRMHNLLSEFGMGRTTGIDLPGELAGLVPSREWKRRARKLPWFPGETLINGIGQGFMLTTPLQLAQVAAILANRGRVLEPHLVREFENPQNGRRSAFTPVERPAVSITKPEAWVAVVEGMHEVVQGARGTARATALGATYQYAGKTGTAQLFTIAQDKRIKVQDITQRLRDHALFISFAPLERPELALGIIVENGESGSHTAAPIARTLFDVYFATRRPSDAPG